MSENPPLSEDFIIRPYLNRDEYDVERIFKSVDFSSSVSDLCGSYVCCFMGMPIGIVVAKISGNYLHIRELVTHKRHQNLGVATALLEHVKKKAVDFSGIKTVVIKVPLQNYVAVSFFKKRLDFLRSDNNDILIFTKKISRIKELTEWLS